ncbi:hypothetical protein [Nocardia sp. NPDC051463]|uniref:hypothetical protein n=1 Tax=Nocardia sp. NPDC051463 TaxID=3154845 RepID=UPI00342B5CF6
MADIECNPSPKEQAMSFPTPYAALRAADFTMEQALEQALLDTSTSFPLFGSIPHIALSIAAVEGPDDFREAGFDFGRMFYSANLLEAAILYCAYQLPTAVEDAGDASRAANVASTYAAARASMDPEAAGAVPAIAEAGIPVAQRVLHYEEILATIRRNSSSWSGRTHSKPTCPRCRSSSSAPGGTCSTPGHRPNQPERRQPWISLPKCWPRRKP